MAFKPDRISTGVAFKKLATAALAGARGPHAIAALIDRRLSALERARGIVGWEKRKAFAADLDATLTTITDELGPADPASAAERALRFLAAAEGVFARVDDSTGQVQAVFHRAAAPGGPDPGRLGRARGSPDAPGVTPRRAVHIPRQDQLPMGRISGQECTRQRTGH